MHVEDAKAVALLVIGRREHQTADHASGDEDASDPGEPRRHATRDSIEVRRRSELVKPDPHLCQVPYSTPIRTAAAAANGASVAVKTSSAPSRYSGPLGGFTCYRKVRGARTENEHRHRERQHQERQQHTAAPDTDRERGADTAEKAERQRAHQQTLGRDPHRCGRNAERHGGHGRNDHERQPAYQPMSRPSWQRPARRPAGRTAPSARGCRLPRRISAAPRAPAARIAVPRPTAHQELCLSAATATGSGSAETGWSPRGRTRVD